MLIAMSNLSKLSGQKCVNDPARVLLEVRPAVLRGQHGAPRVITMDGYAASHRAVDKLKTSGILPRRVQVRSCKYLNNVIEQDHRRIKQRVRPMLGFKRFETAAVTIRGIELAEKIKKQQFNLKPLTGKATTAPEMWAAVLA